MYPAHVACHASLPFTPVQSFIYSRHMAGFKKVSSILALLIELLDPAIMASLRMRVFP